MTVIAPPAAPPTRPQRATQAQHDAWSLICHRSHGILATHCRRHPGYPLGSVVPYVPAAGGLVILISTIAQHTANLQRDARCSLTISAVDDGDVQAAARVSVLADARALDSEEAADCAARYLRFFPEAQDHFATHDFRFWRLQPRSLRYIGGFGQIHWLNADPALWRNPLSAPAEGRACAHMNADHVDAMQRYCAYAGIDPVATAPRMVGADGHALYLRVGDRVHRLPFRTPIDSADDLRRECIAMARADYWQPDRP